MKFAWMILPAVLLLLTSCQPFSDAAAPERRPGSSDAAAATESGPDLIVRLSPEALAKAQIVSAPAVLRTIPQTLRAPGRVTVNEDRVWRLGAITEGRVVEMNSSVDDVVRPGQILARLQSQSVHDRRASYTEANNNVATLEARRTFLAAQAARARRLFDLKAASQQQVQEAESELHDVEGLIANAKAERERQRVYLEEFLRVPVREPDAAGASAAERRASDLVPVMAPAVGTIIARSVAPDSVVQAGQAIYVISDLSSVWVIAEVQQQHLAQIRPGMPVSIHPQAFPDESFPGRVIRIGSELNTATRTIGVRIEASNASLRLRPEMYADVEIAIGSTEQGIFLKQDAIQDLHGQRIVFVRTGEGEFSPRPVEVGMTVNGMRRVLRGVSPGDEVVSEGSFLLKSKLLEASLAE